MQKTEYVHYAEILKANLAFIKQKFNVSELGIFGSYVRGEQDEQSDLDILVRYSKVPCVWNWIELEDYLSLLTGVEVDLVPDAAMKPKIRERVYQEVIFL